LPSRPSAAGSDKVKYFEGTPIPTSVAIVGILALAAWQGAIGDSVWGGAYAVGPWLLHMMWLLFVLSGSLMICKTLLITKL
jgi:CDP-diacylglycerol--serine O-phosphatidyltransferase